MRVALLCMLPSVGVEDGAIETATAERCCVSVKGFPDVCPWILQDSNKLVFSLQKLALSS